MRSVVVVDDVGRGVGNGDGDDDGDDDDDKLIVFVSLCIC